MQVELNIFHFQSKYAGDKDQVKRQHWEGINQLINDGLMVSSDHDYPLLKLIRPPQICMNSINLKLLTKVMRFSAIKIRMIVSISTDAIMEFTNQCIFMSRHKNLVNQFGFGRTFRNEEKFQKSLMERQEGLRLSSNFSDYISFHIIKKS
mmetsp:Transcript_39576/g.60504  ORF Transcript_39576/g.60504 Transcript_39576/m.60504 type:complete len:150 (+) Transcript_39576:7087-7536(+)